MSGTLDPTRAAIVQRLHRGRSRSLLLRASAGVGAALVLAAWTDGDLWDALGSPGTRANIARFQEEMTPRPVRETGDWSAAWPWAERIISAEIWLATMSTLAISVAAIVLAGAGALLLCTLAARSLATPEPWLPGAAPPRGSHRWGWRMIVGLTRGGFMLVRTLPEYVLAFLLVAVFGGQAWPAVLALGLHNMGILGKLGAEVVENAEGSAPRALRGLGSTRLQITLFGLMPRVLPRLLLYFFYRWETCVREATVLGMLGMSTLGYFINDARVRFRYDQMILFVLLGAALVLAGDLLSAWCRHVIRRAA